jgi:hypothetical protein
VKLRGENMIKDIVSNFGYAQRSFEWLKNVLGQDKANVDLLLCKTKNIMDYTEERLVNDGILSPSKVLEPWEWYNLLQIK